MGQPVCAVRVREDAEQRPGIAVITRAVLPPHDVGDCQQVQEGLLGQLLVGAKHVVGHVSVVLLRQWDSSGAFIQPHLGSAQIECVATHSRVEWVLIIPRL